MAIEKETSRGFARFKAQITGATQGDGAVDIDVSEAAAKGSMHVLKDWCITVFPKGTVTAGTLSIGIRPPGVPDTEDHQALATTIDMTSPTPHRFTSPADSLEFTPDSF